LYTFIISPMRLTCPIHLVVLDLVILKPFGEHTNYEAPNYAVFRGTWQFIPFRFEYYFKHPVLKHPSSVFLP
jgi:hypothetical protein